MRAQEFLTEAHHARLATHKAGRYTVHIDSHFLATTAARNIPLRFISRFINYTFIMIPEIETIPRGKGAYVQDTNSLISIYIRRSNSYPLEFTVETVLSPDMKPTPPFFRRSFPFTPNEYKTDPRTIKAQTKMAKDVEQRGRDAVSRDLEDMPFKPQLINRQQRRALAKQARRK
jgi:hypothetical protein